MKEYAFFVPLRCTVSLSEKIARREVLAIFRGGGRLQNLKFLGFGFKTEFSFRFNSHPGFFWLSHPHEVGKMPGDIGILHKLNKNARKNAKKNKEKDNKKQKRLALLHNVQ